MTRKKSSDISAPNPMEEAKTDTPEQKEEVKVEKAAETKPAAKPKRNAVKRVKGKTQSQEAVEEIKPEVKEEEQVEQVNDGQVIVSDVQAITDLVDREELDITNGYSVTNEDYGYYKHAFTADNNDQKAEGLYIKTKTARDALVAISGSVRSYLEAYDANPAPWFNDSDLAPSPESQLWTMLAQYAMVKTNYSYDCFKWLMNDEHAKWRAGITMNNEKVRGIRGQPINMDKAKISIRNATNVVSSALNLGSKRELFLPHSGFSVTVRPATLSEFIECERKIGGDTLELLRNSRGLLMSSEMTYVYSAIMDLFLGTVVSCDLGDISPQFLKDNIAVPDLQLIAWLMACSKYPNGYLLTLPCFANPGRCNYITHETIDLRKLYRVNNARITQTQRDLASKVTNDRTLEELSIYANEFDFDGLDQVELTSYNTDLKISVRFGVPSISQYQASAVLYKDILMNAADNAFATPLVGEARERYVLAQFESMRAMLYDAWVLGIVIEDENGDRVEINEMEEIRDLLIQISSDQYLLKTFLVGVEKFINRATVAVVGIPNVACPGCGGFHETTEESGIGHHVIPLDAVSFFITLCQQQINSSPAVAEALMNKNTEMNNENNTEATTEM